MGSRRRNLPNLDFLLQDGPSIFNVNIPTILNAIVADTNTAEFPQIRNPGNGDYFYRVYYMKVTEFLQAFQTIYWPDIQISSAGEIFSTQRAFQELGLQIAPLGITTHAMNVDMVPGVHKCTHFGCNLAFHTEIDFEEHYQTHRAEAPEELQDLEPIWLDLLSWLEEGVSPSFADWFPEVRFLHWKDRINRADGFIECNRYTRRISELVQECENLEFMSLKPGFIVVERSICWETFNAFYDISVPCKLNEPVVSRPEYVITKREANYSREFLLNMLENSQIIELLSEEIPDQNGEQEANQPENEEQATRMPVDTWLEVVGVGLRGVKRENFGDIEPMIAKWTQIEITDWGAAMDTDEEAILARLYRKTGTLPAFGITCPFIGCKYAKNADGSSKKFKNNKALRGHLERCHQNIMKHYSGQTDLLMLKNFRDETEGVAGYTSDGTRVNVEGVSFCLCKNCTFFGHNSAMLTHRKGCHNELNVLMKDYGSFWPTMYEAAQRRRGFITVNDWTRPRPGFMCKEPGTRSEADGTMCKHVFSSLQGLKNHHESKIHGMKYPANQRPEYEEAELVLEDVLIKESEEQRAMNERRQQQEREELDDIASDPIVRERLARELNKRLKNERRQEALDKQLDDGNDIAGYWKDIPHEELQAKCVKWLEKYKLEEEQALSFPKMDQEKRAIIFEGLKKKFRERWVSLAQEGLMRMDIEHASDEEKRIRLDGIVYKVNHQMRKHIEKRLEITPTGSKHGTLGKKAAEAKAKVEQLKKSCRRAEKVIVTLTRLRDIVLKVNATGPETNEGNVLMEEILRMIEANGSQWGVDVFGGSDAEAVRRCVGDTEEHFEAKMDWLREKLQAELSKLGENPQLKHKLRNSYADDPGRTIRNVVLKEETPGTSLVAADFGRHYGEGWEARSDFVSETEDGRFRTGKKLGTTDNEIILHAICEVEEIQNIIETRSHRSAQGPDAIGYAIFKVAKKESARYLAKLFRFVVLTGMIPDSWKRSRTVLLYKKDDPNLPQNWRPVGITTAQYRLFMCSFNKGIQNVNRIHPVIGKEQKGFVSGINGIAEHIGSLQEVAAAMRRRGSHGVMMMLDFANAFGSIPHELIIDSLEQKGFCPRLVELIVEVYADHHTYIEVGSTRTEGIKVNVGVIQGCPMSPILFDLALEPLLDALRREHADDGFSPALHPGERDDPFIVQAYADDICLVANSMAGMQRILNTVQDFCTFTGMKLAAHKCVVLANPEAEGDIMIGDDVVKRVSLVEGARYLGIKVTEDDTVKMESGRVVLEQMRVKAIKVFGSGLSFQQKVHALQTFINPMLDFQLLNGWLGNVDLDTYTQFLRGLVSKDIGNHGLPIPFFHMKNAHGGLGIPDFRRRRNVLLLSTYGKLLTCRDRKVRDLIQSAAEEEATARGILPDNDSTFMEWRLDERGRPVCTHVMKTNTIVIKAARAAHELRLGVKVREKNGMTVLEVKDLLATGDEAESIMTFTNPGEIIGSLDWVVRQRDVAEMGKYQMHGHAWPTAAAVPHGNKLYCGASRRTGDEVSKFAIKARLNVLPTGEVLSKRIGGDVKFCTACSTEDVKHVDSLAHRLNSCHRALGKMTWRHNLVEGALVEGLKEENKRATIFRNSTIASCFKGVVFTDEVGRMKPDIVMTLEDKVIVVEVTVPYGEQTDRGVGEEEGERGCSLDKAAAYKKQKYSKAVEEMNLKLDNEVEYLTVVVSSVGVVPMGTYHAASKLFKKRKRLKRVLTRMSLMAVVGSWCIFTNRAPKLLGYDIESPWDKPEDEHPPEQRDDEPLAPEQPQQQAQPQQVQQPQQAQQPQQPQQAQGGTDPWEELAHRIHKQRRPRTPKKPKQTVVYPKLAISGATATIGSQPEQQDVVVVGEKRANQSNQRKIIGRSLGLKRGSMMEEDHHGPSDPS